MQLEHPTDPERVGIQSLGEIVTPKPSTRKERLTSRCKGTGYKQNDTFVCIKNHVFKYTVLRFEARIEASREIR